MNQFLEDHFVDSCGIFGLGDDHINAASGVFFAKETQAHRVPGAKQPDFMKPICVNLRRRRVEDVQARNSNGVAHLVVHQMHRVAGDQKGFRAAPFKVPGRIAK